MSKNEIDPKVRKAVWQIIIYVVSVLAGIFGGQVAQENGYGLISKNDSSYVERCSD